MPREVVLDDRRKPDHLDLIAERDGVPVGAASTAKFGGAPDGELRVPDDARRCARSGGRASARRCTGARPSTHGSSASRASTWSHATTTRARSATTARAASPSSAACKTSSSSSRTPTFEPSAPDGISIVAADAEYDRGAYEVALEADADIPSGEPIVSGPYEQWHDRHFGAMAIRDLSFVALDGESCRRLRDPQPAHRGHGRALR